MRERYRSAGSPMALSGCDAVVTAAGAATAGSASGQDADPVDAAEGPIKDARATPGAVLSFDEGC